MTITEVLLIGVALSMDAFSVSLSSGMVYPNLTRARRLMMPVMFGIFQGIMPAAGYFLGYWFRDIISRWQGPISLIILGLIGFNMIRDGIKAEEGGNHADKQLTVTALIALAVATSIDAFAVGVSFAASGVSVSLTPLTQNIFIISSMIAATTFVLCLIALALGRAASDKLGDRAQIVGGILLIIIGIKNMFF